MATKIAPVETNDTIQIPKKKAIRIGLILLVVLGIGISGFFFLKSYQKKQREKEIKKTELLRNIIQMEAKIHIDSIGKTWEEKFSKQATIERVSVTKRSQENHVKAIEQKNKRYEQIDNTRNHDSLRKLLDEFLSN